MCGKCKIVFGKQIYVASNDEEYNFYFENVDRKKIVLIDQRPKIYDK